MQTLSQALDMKQAIVQDILTSSWLHLHESEQTYAADLCALSIQQTLHGVEHLEGMSCRKV